MKNRTENKSHQINIEYANASDIFEVATLYKIFWGDEMNLEKMISRFNEISTSDRNHLLVAKFDGKVIGTIYGVICEELYGDCKPFIVMEDLIVDKSFRRNGIAKLLLMKIESIGKDRGCSQIQFITEANRSDAVDFYETMGYNSKVNIGFKKKL